MGDDVKDENIKLKKKLKMVMTEAKQAETLTKEQFKAMEEEMVNLREIQAQILEQAKQLAAGGSDDVEKLKAALIKSKQNEAALTKQLEEGGGMKDGEATVVVSGAAAEEIEDLRSKVKQRDEEIDKINANMAKKAQAMQDWAQSEITRSENAQKKEKDELLARIRELEDGQGADAAEMDREVRALKKKIKNMSATGGEKNATVKEVYKRHQEIKRDYAKLREDAKKQHAMIGPELEKFAAQIKEQVASETKRTKRAVKKYHDMVKENKKLYNQIQELRGNIRVYCRTRPLGADEGENCASFSGKPGEIVIRDPTKGDVKKIFQFDQCFGADSTQEQVFEDTRPLITSVLDGFNVCIFAYGQTGSGKTYTMTGPPDNPGVNGRALAELFRLSEERKADYDIEILVSTLEIYNEDIYDLLKDRKSQQSAREKMQIREGPNGMFIPGLTEQVCSTQQEVEEVIERGTKNRSAASTDMNEHSSRSHALLRIVVRCKNIVAKVTTVGKLTLVDLAGSERVGKSGATGQRLLEAQNINQSLSALGDCISSLTGDAKHIPYRNSKLTHLLKDSLGGNSKTLMFVQVSPNAYNVSETLCSLQFALRVASVKLQIASANVESPDVAKYKQEVEALKAQLGKK